MLDNESTRNLFLAVAAESGTFYDIADLMGVSRSSVTRALASNPEFKAIYEAVLYAASEGLLERLREIPFQLGIDPQRARVQIEALRTYLELRWPSRYGKRLDVTVRHADMRGAMDRARARIEARAISATVIGPVDANSGPVMAGIVDEMNGA